MSRKFKAIGLALIAVFAMSAFAAAGAQAATFNSEVNTTYYQGSQVGTNTFSTTAGNVKCKSAVFSGEATGTSLATVKVSPSYAECTAFGQNAVVTTAGCEYTLNAGGTVDSVTGCTAGSVVVHVSAGNCTVTVPNQTFSGAAVTYSNEGSGASRDVLVTADVTSKIDYTVDGPGTICGTAGTYLDHGSYTGSVTTKGYKNAGRTEQVGVWVA